VSNGYKKILGVKC